MYSNRPAIDVLIIPKLATLLYHETFTIHTRIAALLDFADKVMFVSR